MQIVKVCWQDSFAGQGWISLADANDQSASQVESIGYLVRDDDLAIVLARDVDDTIVNGVLTIPAGAVVSKEVLSENN